MDPNAPKRKSRASRTRQASKRKSASKIALAVSNNNRDEKLPSPGRPSSPDIADCPMKRRKKPAKTSAVQDALCGNDQATSAADTSKLKAEAMDDHAEETKIFIAAEEASAAAQESMETLETKADVTVPMDDGTWPDSEERSTVAPVQPVVARRAKTGDEFTGAAMEIQIKTEYSAVIKSEGDIEGEEMVKEQEGNACIGAESFGQLETPSDSAKVQDSSAPFTEKKEQFQMPVKDDLDDLSDNFKVEGDHGEGFDDRVGEKIVAVEEATQELISNCMDSVTTMEPSTDSLMLQDTQVLTQEDMNDLTCRIAETEHSPMPLIDMEAERVTYPEIENESSTAPSDISQLEEIFTSRNSGSSSANDTDALNDDMGVPIFTDEEVNESLMSKEDNHLALKLDDRDDHSTTDSKFNVFDKPIEEEMQASLDGNDTGEFGGDDSVLLVSADRVKAVTRFTKPKKLDYPVLSFEKADGAKPDSTYWAVRVEGVQFLSFFRTIASIKQAADNLPLVEQILLCQNEDGTNFFKLYTNILTKHFPDPPKNMLKDLKRVLLENYQGRLARPSCSQILWTR